MSISVIIPVHNRQHVISRAIDSVLNQTVLPDEIIVIDDGSTDGTGDYVRETYPQIRVIVQPHSGVSAARNTGISQSQHNWIALLDSDDEWQPKKLAQQIESLTKKPEYLVSHTDEIWIRNGKRVNPMKKHQKPDGWIFEHCLPLCCVSPSSIMIHRSLFDQVGLFDESLEVCEDYDLWLRLFSVVPVLLVPEKLVIKYGGHEDQLSRKYWGMDRYRIQALCQRLDDKQFPDKYRELVKSTLSEKLDIVINGFIKREKMEDAKHFQNLKKAYI